MPDNDQGLRHTALWLLFPKPTGNGVRFILDRRSGGKPSNADTRDDLSLLNLTASLYLDKQTVDETFSVSST
jgi:hypothetical protein